MSILRKLPTKPSINFSKWSVSCIDDYYRKLYQRSLDYYDSFITNKVSIIQNPFYGQHESIKSSSLIPKWDVFQLHGGLSKYNKSIQSLIECSTQNHKNILSLAYDFITAFYIPEGVGRVIISMNGCKFRFDTELKYEPIEDLCHQARNIPKELPLSELLRISREDTELTFSMDVEIEIDGEKYIRFTPFHPFWPSCATRFTEALIEFPDISGETNFYIEICLISNMKRKKMRNDTFVIWGEALIKEPDDPPPLFMVREDSIQKLAF